MLWLHFSHFNIATYSEMPSLGKVKNSSLLMGTSSPLSFVLSPSLYFLLFSSLVFVLL